MNRDLPFSRWRHRPQPGEPSYGYFTRLVADEGHGSMKIYATEIGINGRNFVPEEMLHVLQRLPLTEAEKQSLERSTPILRVSHYRIGNERIRESQLSYRLRRFCPHCLAASPYHRIQWDVVAASHCPAHGTALTDKVDGRRIGWWWPHFDVGPGGAAMADKSNAVADRELPFHQMLQTRLELGEREQGPTASFDLCDLIDPARTLGRFVKAGTFTHPWRNKQIDIEAGYAVARMSHAERVEWFSRWYEGVFSADTRRKGFTACGGNEITSRTQADFANNPLWLEIEHAQYEGFAQVGTLGRKGIKRQTVRGDKTLKETAEALGLPLKGVGPFVRAMNFLPDAKWNGDAHSIDAVTFDKIKASIDDLIPLLDTNEITGIVATEFRRLARAGYVREFLQMPTNGKGGPKYLASEVRKIVDHFRSMTNRKVTRDMKSLLGYARSKGLTVGQVLVMTLEGKLKPAGANLSRPGLKALYFHGCT